MAKDTPNIVEPEQIPVEENKPAVNLTTVWISDGVFQNINPETGEVVVGGYNADK